MQFSTWAMIVLGLNISQITATSVRDNDGNCEGVKSCRPRCITFRVERDILKCGSMEGIFTVQEDINPWDTKRFSTANCNVMATCENSLCGSNLFGDLTVRVGEGGYHGSYYYTVFDLPEGEDDRFTFCSMYPCTKEECALPEQMGLELQFSIFQGSVGVNDFDAIPLLVQEFYLKAAFVGNPVQINKINRYGPMHVEWMDDPAGCRTNHLSIFAPVAPPLDPIVWTSNTPFDASLYCSGDEYIPEPLPMVAPTLQPTSSPTFQPSMSFSPTSSPSHTAIGEEQIDGLRTIFDSTMMSSAVSQEVHNWFKSPDYCRFTGVTCDERGYVIMLDLTDRRLAGTLPSNLEKLGRLRQLKLVNNRIKGSIPENLCNLGQLTQVELGTNQLTGSVPGCLHRLRHLRRLLLQYNNLSGTIPSEFCQFGQLSAFDIAGNGAMYGVIPQCMGSLPLDFLRVDNVGLVGTVPPLLCSRKTMNGLSPNPYGCNAIACPAGTYEPTVGRTYKAGTQCVTCELPSNVIGSTSCRYVLNNTVISVTDAPTFSQSLSPSFAPGTETELPTFIVLNDTAPSLSPQPSANYSSQPSLSPSWNTSVVPSMSPSNVTSGDTSDVPSPPPTTFPSSVSTSNPSLGSELVTVTAVFSDVQVPLDTDGLQKLTMETMIYLVSNNIFVERVTILSQSFDHSPSGARIIDRRLADSLEINMEIEGRSNGGNFQEQVQAFLVDDFSSYYNIVLDAIPALKPDITVPSAVPVQDPTRLPTRAPTQIKEQNEFIVQPKINSTNWWLLGSAVALSVVAIIAVLFVRESRRRARRNRLFAVEQTGIVDLRDPPSVLLDGDLGDDNDGALSSESSSGWNSTSSPGEFVNDEAVREWTSGIVNDSDMYLMAQEKGGKLAVQVI